MTTYATVSDYEAYFGPIEAIETSAIDNPGALSLDKDRLERALVVASAEMDSYLSRKYDIQALRSATPEMLVAICLDITRYRLLIHRVPEEYAVRYKHAIARLMDLSSGKADLGGVWATDGSINAENARTLRLGYGRSAPRIWTRDRFRTL